VHTALKDDNMDSALNELQQLARNLEEADKNITADNNNWKGHKSALDKSLRHIDHYKTIAEVRKAFADISKHIIQIEKQFGHITEDSYYEIFCPMAFDNKGAYWMQSSKQISNPYFGKKMLRCGEIKSELPSQKQDKI